MSHVPWTTAYSVDSRASLPFEWGFMTNVENWHDPPATFKLEGPFTAGTRGTTHIPGQESRRWQLKAANQLESYVLDTELDGAIMSFEWRFNRLSDGTRLTQHIILMGQNAAAYVSQVQEAFGSNLAAGMSKIVAAIEQAEAVAISGIHPVHTEHG